MKLREANLNDAKILAEYRYRQLLEEEDQFNLEAIVPKDFITILVEYFNQHLETENFIQVVFEDEGLIVATGAIILYQFPPSFDLSHGLKAYVTNMYTLPKYRKNGLASKILEELKAHAKQKGAQAMWLGASPMGEPVYLKSGFVKTERMDFELD